MQEEMVMVRALKPVRYNGVEYRPDAKLEIEKSRVGEWGAAGLTTTNLNASAVPAADPAGKPRKPGRGKPRKPGRGKPGAETADRQPGESPEDPKKDEAE